METHLVSPWQDFVPAEWKAIPNYHSALAELVAGAITIEQTKTFAPYSDFAALLSDDLLQVSPIRFPKSFKLPSIAFDITYTSGQMGVLANAGDREIPAGDYLLCLSPVYSTADGGISEDRALGVLRLARGFVTASIGPSATHHIAATFKINPDNTVSSSSPLFQNYGKAGVADYIRSDQLSELLHAVRAHSHKEIVRRWRTAFRLLGEAASATDAAAEFMLTWIALEVSYGGEGKARQPLTEISPDGSAELLDHLGDMRNALVHEGISPKHKNKHLQLMRALIIYGIARRYERIGKKIFALPQLHAAFRDA
jgi:hypothetical protein